MFNAAGPSVPMSGRSATGQPAAPQFKRGRMAEKRTRQLPNIRVSESLEMALMRLASRDERSLSDYVWRVLEKHCFGHGASLGDEGGAGNDFGAQHCTSPEGGMS